MRPILLLGAGQMGGALITGWIDAGAFAAEDLILCDPHPGEKAVAAAAAGASLNPSLSAVGAARTVLLAVKPQLWREAAAMYGPHLDPKAIVVSIAAGVTCADLAAGFARPIARVMPTTAVAIRQGVASIFAESEVARAAARALFGPVAEVVELPEEGLIDVATAVSGSAPAYLYAFVEALEAAGRQVGLSPEIAAVLARKTIAGAAALMDLTAADPAELRRQVTSKGGTTEAALRRFEGDSGLKPLLLAAVSAALARARALAA